jgi:ribosomal protein S18 acetylase RimI-like enzyme
MQRLISRSWALEKPHVNVHVGDLEWWVALVREEPDVISLWLEGGELVAWAWVSPPAELESHIDADHRNGPLLDQMLAWFEATASERPLPSGELVSFQFDPDAERRQLMESRGYRMVDHGYVHFARSLMGSLLDPEIPRGFAIRHLRGPEDIERRVAVHRSAFSPSRMTAARYHNVMASTHYRSDLDWVVEASNGEFASFCTAWLDPESAVALLEPVGTAEGHRRMGLASIACLASMGAAARQGADTAVVLSADDNPGSLALYRSLGFEEVGRTYRYTRRMR